MAATPWWLNRTPMDPALSASTRPPWTSDSLSAPTLTSPVRSMGTPWTSFLQEWRPARTQNPPRLLPNLDSLEISALVIMIASRHQTAQMEFACRSSLKARAAMVSWQDPALLEPSARATSAPLFFPLELLALFLKMLLADSRLFADMLTSQPASWLRCTLLSTKWSPTQV